MLLLQADFYVVCLIGMPKPYWLKEIRSFSSVPSSNGFLVLALSIFALLTNLTHSIVVFLLAFLSKWKNAF